MHCGFKGKINARVCPKCLGTNEETSFVLTEKEIKENDDV